MTACIIGWALNPLWRLRARPSKACLCGRSEALADAGVGLAMSTLVLAISRRLSAQDFTASLVLQASLICA